MLNHDKLDQFLATLDQAVDDNAMRRAFATYSASYDLNVPADPDSPAYRQQQLALYERLAGKPYSPANEVMRFDFDAAIASPFPYCTWSADTVGNQLMAIGFLIKAMALPRGARILEFGFGWGNTTLALAQMGYDVTAVDIEKKYCELLDIRAAMHRQTIHVVHADFDYLKTVEPQFDAVLYFECFHHASNHLELMAGFDRVLSPGGIVCFGAEPITPDFPLPWGLRMDGESLWAIRRKGWLELGYNERYFESTMRRFGWGLTQHRGADSPWASVWVARRLREMALHYRHGPGGLQTQVGQPDAQGCLHTSGQAGFLVYGPYAELPAGRWQAQLSLEPTAPRSGTVLMQVCAGAGQQQLAQSPVALETGGPALVLAFDLAQTQVGLEVRLQVPADAQVVVTDLQLTPV